MSKNSTVPAIVTFLVAPFKSVPFKTAPFAVAPFIVAPLIVAIFALCTPFESYGYAVPSSDAMLSGRVTSLLITSFQPFAGNSDNKSAQTADVLKRSMAVYLPTVHVEVCVLPVEYDKAAAKLMRCLRDMSIPAQRILSLGEKMTPVVLVETQATNWDNEPRGSDAAGVWRKGSKIIKDAPQAVRFFGYPIDVMMNRVSFADRSKIIRSSNMENFVCNNTAFITEMTLKERVPFLFIHVPDGNSKNNDPVESARLILELAFWQ